MSTKCENCGMYYARKEIPKKCVNCGENMDIIKNIKIDDKKYDPKKYFC